MEDCIGAYRKSLSLYSSLKSALLSAVSQGSSFLLHPNPTASTSLPPKVTDALWFLTHLQQNSSPAPAPDPKPTMIDEWAVSVKPSTDPTIIKKHIEKMVEVSVFTPTHAPFPGSCWLYASVPGRRGGGKWGESSVLILSTTVLTLYLQLSNFRWSKTWYRSPAFSVLFGVVTISTFLYLMLNVCVTGFNLSNTVLLAGEDWWASLSSMLVLSILFEHNKTQDSTTNWYEIVCTKGILVSLKRFLLKVQHQGEANISEDSGASASTMFSLCQTTLLNVRPSAVPT